MSELEHQPSPWKRGPDAKIPGLAPSRTGTAGWARLERAWWPALVGTMVVFSIFPLANMLLGLSTKDYGLWYQVGRAVRLGMDVYPRPESGRLFPFMYPPSAAAMLGVMSLLGPTGTLIAAVLVNSASWMACILLSLWLAAGRGKPRHPLVVIVPSLAVIVLIHNIFLLGQPNLLLLALVLGAFVCLRLGREYSAGALVATAAAIKAFPLLILGYLVYRRMWRASAATVAVLAAWLLLAPLPFRTPAQAVDDVSVWTRGMLFTYNTHGIAQRPLRSYSYKNQSIMALMHRLLRDVPADGESVLSRRARVAEGGPRPATALDPATDLLSFLKPHQRASRPARPAVAVAPEGTATGPDDEGAGTTEPTPRWDEAVQGAEPALRAAWRVNVLDLDFRTVTLITLGAMLVLSLYFVAVMPARPSRTPETDALEFALVTLLTVIFSPLSFNYAYVWLLYPITLAVHRVSSEPADTPGHRLKVGWLAAVLLIPALAIPMPQMAQACGNLFLPALLLVFGLGAMLKASARRQHESAGSSSIHHPHLDHRGSRAKTAASGG
ncbi:MAG: glycosyltransferase 87 family protein [Isosphaeraceae bacterium]